MENQGIIDKIKSVYIIKNIFNFIKNSNYQLKLFIYSKYFQNKLNIKLIDYKEQYLKKLKFNLELYLYSKEQKNKVDLLKQKYNKFLSDNKLNKEIFEDILYEVLESKQIKDIDEEEVNNINKDYDKKININSPLFEKISKTKMFEKNLSIYISQKKSKNDYIKIFDKLNESNIKYSSIFYDIYYNAMDENNYLKELNINYNNIKKLTLNIKYDIDYEEDILYENNKDFFETFFSFNNIQNNLIYLNIDFDEENYLTSELFENINDFKSLKYLYICNFNFDNNFIIKIINLKLLYCEKCSNITISDTFCQKLEILNFIDNNISNIKHLENVNLKELKELNLYNNNISDIKILEKIKFDKLKILNLSGNNISDINSLVNANLKELKDLNLYNNKIIDINALENAKFDQLTILNFGSNKISDINILENVNLIELKELKLYKNKISDIKVLEILKFDRLEILDLSYNEISDINILEHANLKKLKELDLSSNKISDIKVFEKVKFEKLKKLNLRWNNISDINILENVNLKELEILNLSCNNISNINVLEKLKLYKLEILDLSFNKIPDKYNLEKVKFEVKVKF